RGHSRLSGLPLSDGSAARHRLLARCDQQQHPLGQPEANHQRLVQGRGPGAGSDAPGHREILHACILALHARRLWQLPRIGPAEAARTRRRAVRHGRYRPVRPRLRDELPAARRGAPEAQGGRMIARLLLAVALLTAAAPVLAGDPNGPVHVSSGTIVDLGVLKSKYADPRRVVVWLPTGYSAHGPKYAVLYMHDGQNLFDKNTAGYGMEWQIDETLDRLIQERKVRPTIVVGIWNTPKRLQEYVPSKAFNGLPPSYRGKIRAL